MVRDKHGRPEDPASMGAGDSSLGQAPPNVEQVQPPAEEIVDRAATRGTAAAGGGNSGYSARDGDGSANDAAAGAALDAELEALRADLKDASERHLRLAAEFDNYRKRVDRERQDSWARAQGELASRLLDVLDDLERVAHHGDTSSAQGLLEGVQLVEKKLRTVLSAAGLEPIDPQNASFDPNSMEAVAMVAAESPEDDDVVSDVFQRGYRFKGQLLRPARVRVKKHH